MTGKIQPVRGMNDIIPPDTALWQHTEIILRKTLHSFGFNEIRTPIVERTELFKRTIGEVTDIVEKEMYTFKDRNDESLTLRPELTAGVVRAAIEHNLLYGQTPRLWAYGPNFRYEKPQKGRYRQFYQLTAEVFGFEGPDIDAELILLSAAILEKLSLSQFCKLQINTLGTSESRKKYRSLLVDYFNKHKKALDEDSLHRLTRNPLRILDSKNPDLAEIIQNAPKLIDHLDEESANHFEKLQAYLQQANIPFEVNSTLVRGLDYYTKTVFEWVTDKLGAQGTVLAGGRYDGLVAQLGYKSTPALGFSLGMERTLLLIAQSQFKHKRDSRLHAYLITDDSTFAAGLKVANYLRKKVPGLHLIQHCGGGSMKSQFKKADKSGAQFALVIGEHELKTRSVTIKNLREEYPQQSLYHDELAEYLHLKISTKK